MECLGNDKGYYRQLVYFFTLWVRFAIFLFLPFRRPAQPVYCPLLVAHEFSVRLNLEHESLDWVVIFFYFPVEQVHHVEAVSL